MPETCPSKERWQEHLSGSLPADQDAVLTEHLDSCANCRRTLETLAGGGDSLLAVARQAGDATDASSPALKGVVEQFQAPSEQTQAEVPNASDDSLPFLTPSEKPNCLGRLGHYEVKAVIGKGGFGIVLKAFDEKLHRIVAIKVLSPAYAAIGSARKRFIREARAAAAVSHDHVVGIYAVEETQDPPYIVMQCVDGQSLQDKLDKQGSLSLKEILRIGLQTAEGLAAAHKQGLVHRDIKPANILLENGVERVKITDFGLARAVDDASITQSGTVAGTPMYMSPEQAEGLPIDHRSDLFSLGTVLYAMCTGHPAFRASGTHAVLKRVIDASPRPIREVNNEIPDWLCNIIAKLHAKKPEDRFQTAKEVAELLGARLADVQAGRAIGRVESPQGTVEMPVTEAINRPVPQRGSSRYRWAAAVIGIVTIVGLAFWLQPFLSLFLTNSARIEINGVNASEIGWVLSRDGEAVKEFNSLGFQQFNVPPGDYVLTPVKRPLNLGLRYQMRLDGLLAGTGTSEEQDILQFTLNRGESLRITVKAGPRKIIDSPEKKDEPGWVQLFNGKDLTGWKTHPVQPGNWRVEQEALVGSVAPGARSHLYSERGDFQDFHLRFEAWINEPGNSGVCFRCGDAPELDPIRLAPRSKPSPRSLWHPIGYEADINPGQADSRTGSLWRVSSNPIVKGIQEKLVSPGTWFPMELIARGGHIIIKVNGKTTVDWMDEANPHPRGHLALQVWHDQTLVKFRKIEINELPPEEPDWVQLFNGKDLTGWRAAIGKKDAWGVKGDAIVGSGQWNYLFTEKETYRDFHLRAKVKINDKGDSGIMFRGPVISKDLWQAQILSGADENGTGSLFRDTTKVVSVPSPNIPGDTWFDFEVIAQGNQIETRVNGKVAATAQDRNRFAGAIGLESGSLETVVHFKKIEIKELPTEEPRLVIAGTPRLRKTIDTKDRVSNVAYGADSTSLIVAGGALTFYHTITGEVIHEEKLADRVTAPLSLSKDRKTLVIVHPKAALVFDLPFRKVPLQSRPGFVFSAALSPDAKILAYGGDKEGLFFHDRGTGKTLEENRHGRLVGLQYSPNGQFLIGVGPDHATAHLTILDAQTRDLIAKKPIGRLGGIDISQDSKRLVVTGMEGKNFGFFVYSLPGHELLFKEMSFPKMPVSVSFSPDGNYLALGLMTGEAQIWDLAEKKVVVSWMPGNTDPPAPTGVTFAPDGKTLATWPGHGNKIQFWDLTAEPGWVQLFNGKELTDWKEGRKTDAKWTVEKDVLIGRAGDRDKPPSFLLTERSDYRDFHFRIEAMTDADEDDGGQCFRFLFRAGSWKGYEAQIQHKGPWEKTGSLWWSNTPGKSTGITKVDQVNIRGGEWFTQEVIAKGSRITVILNGKVMSESSDPAYDIGHLALLLQGGTIRFRKIEIKELPPEEPGFVLLFNGKDLTGWAGDLTKWKVENDTLVPDPKLVPDAKAAPFLQTARDYKNFALRFDCRLGPKDLTGILHLYLHGPADKDKDGQYVRLSFFETGQGTRDVLGAKGAIEKQAYRLADEKFKSAQWNPIEIHSVDGKIQVISNGKTVTTFDAPKVQAGYIALHSLAGAWSFRNIEIKELPVTKTP